MLATQACPNSRQIESEQGDENGFDVPVLSSDESSPSLKHERKMAAQARGVPMKKRKNGGLRMTALMVFIVAMADAGGCALRASMTQNEKMKYRPDRTPAPSVAPVSSSWPTSVQRLTCSDGGPWDAPGMRYCDVLSDTLADTQA